MIVPMIAEDLQGIVRLGLVGARPVAVGPAGDLLLAEIEAARAELVQRHAGQSPSDIDGLDPARRLYRAFGIDPTRTRPSSEALLRRALQGKPLPRILNAVDLCNLCALRFLLPIGLYDAASVRGDVTLRRGLPGEMYQGVRKDEVHLEGRPVLADQQGPFGNPTADSLRTAVTAETRALWMVIFGPITLPASQMETYVRRSCEAMAIHLAPPGDSAQTEGRVV